MALYTSIAPGIAFVDQQCVLGIYNGVGSGKTIKLYRAIALNNQTQTVTTSTQLYLSLYRFTTGSGGLTMSPLKHDSTAVAMPAQIVCSTNMSYTIDAFIKRISWSTKEPLAANTAFVSELQTIPAWTTFGDYSQSLRGFNAEPLVLREGYGAGIIVQVPSGGSIGTAAVADYILEFDVS